MRGLFREYYRPTDEEFSSLWKNGTFVFDTNVLLNLYRYTSSTRDELLHIIESLQERIWLPHQVGLEFSRNRTSVILDQNKIFDLINFFNTFVQDKFEKDIVQNHGKRGHFFADLEKIRTILQKTRQALQEELDQARAQQPDPIKHDPVLERLDTLFKGRIGLPYSDDEMTKLSREYDERFKKKVPPGFKDDKKNTDRKQDRLDDPNNPGNKYGDVILWFQIIDYAKQKKQPIILVVDDVKGDWWEQIHGKKQGPRIELRREIQEKADVPFYMYDADNFIEVARDFLSVQVSLATIQEVRENRIQEAERRKEQTVAITNSAGHLLPASMLHDITRQAQLVQQAINALGGPTQLTKEMRLQQELFRKIQPFLLRSEQQREEEEDQEVPQDTEDDEQEQQDNSLDGNT